MNPHEQRIALMLGSILRAWRQRELSGAVALGGLALVAWLLALILVDNFAMLSTAVLLGAWGVLIGALVIGVAWLILRLSVSRPGAVRLALMYEGRVPGQHNRLINAVEFIGTRLARREPLALTAVMESATAIDPGTAPHAVDFRRVRWTTWAALALTGLTLLYAVARPDWFFNGLSRALCPWAPIEHLWATAPQVKPGDVELVEGAPLRVEATLHLAARAVAPDRVSLEYRLADGRWVDVTMSADAGHFVHDFGAVRAPLDYRVRAGRSLSAVYHVGVIARPRVAHLQLSVQRPEYAGGGAQKLEANVGDVTCLAGSTVSIELTASADLRTATLELGDGRRVLLTCGGGSSRGATGRLVAESSTTYTLLLQDTAGRASLDPPRYTVTVTPDEAPVTVVLRPGRDLIVAPGTVVPIAAEAQDDFGLTRVALQIRRPSQGDWLDVQSEPCAGAGARHASLKGRLDPNKLGVVTGQTLLYRVIAQDCRQPQPNVGLGRTWSITVAESEQISAALAAQTRRLLDALQQILALQRENRAGLDLDRPTDPLRTRQDEIRARTQGVRADYAKGVRPQSSILDELTGLIDGPMQTAAAGLHDYGGEYATRVRRKADLLKTMDEIITRIEALVGKLQTALGAAEQAQQALSRLPPAEREQALENIRSLLSKLHAFVPDQDKVIADSEELARKAPDLTTEQRAALNRTRGTEDKWADVFTDSVKDITKLTEQGFADKSVANDYKEMVEQIEEASKNLTPDLVKLAVPREQSGRELATALVEEMEMWLPNSPDHVQWMMEEPTDFPEIPMVPLPDQISDLVGDLIEQQDALNDAAEDKTSAWADSLAKGAGWEVAGGPISNFSAVGKTGNQLPDNNELSGRSGDGRSGRSQGTLVEDTAKGLPGRTTPTRVTNDPYQEGVVKELQQLATSGATGGGKARGAGQEGLQGQSPPPLFTDMQFMQEWQKRIRQEAERVAGQLKMVQINLPDMDRVVGLMKQTEQAYAEGRYGDLFRLQQMILQHLRMTGDTVAREVALRVERAYQLPPDQRRRILDSLSEPVPTEYRAAVERYFQQLSESP